MSLITQKTIPSFSYHTILSTSISFSHIILYPYRFSLHSLSLSILSPFYLDPYYILASLSSLYSSSKYSYSFSSPLLSSLLYLSAARLLLCFNSLFTLYFHTSPDTQTLTLFLLLPISSLTLRLLCTSSSLSSLLFSTLPLSDALSPIHFLSHSRFTRLLPLIYLFLSYSISLFSSSSIFSRSIILFYNLLFRTSHLTRLFYFYTSPLPLSLPSLYLHYLHSLFPNFLSISQCLCYQQFTSCFSLHTRLIFLSLLSIYTLVFPIFLLI